MQEHGLDYKDVYLVPEYSPLNSRSEASTEVQFGPRKFDLPIVMANMKSIVNFQIVCSLAKHRYFYIMHRFGIDVVEFCKSMLDKGLYLSISVGVNKDSMDELLRLKLEGIKPEYFCLDIAHAHSIKCYNMIQFIKHHFPDCFLIAGNVCTPEGVVDLERWGADSVKVGIGRSKICTTFPQTGFTTPQFTAMLNCSDVAKKPLISDGNVSDNGSFAKAIRAGASMVMAGGIFSGMEDNSGEIIEENGIKYKKFYGSASSENKGENKHVEGKSILVPIKGSFKDKYREIKESLQSAISYSGGSLETLKNVKWGILRT